MTASRVVAVSRDEFHRFSKGLAESITLVAGLGVLGDAHAGTLVQHRSRVRRDPNQPNLRQVHLLHHEVFNEARSRGYLGQLQVEDHGERVADLLERYRADVAGVSCHPADGHGAHMLTLGGRWCTESVVVVWLDYDFSPAAA